MRYGVLFEVEVLHDFFLSLGSRVEEALDDAPRDAARRGYATASFLEVFPTDRTRQVLAGHQSIFKATPAGFLVGVKLDPSAPDDRPVVPPGADLRLSFALRVKDPRFFNYTTLAAAAPPFYRFSNSPGNEAAGGRFLSLSVPGHDTARAYEAGEVHADTSGPTINLFRAVRDTGPGARVAADWERIPPDTHDPTATYAEGAVVLAANRLFRALVNGPDIDLTDAAEWQPIGTLANQYVTAADGLILRAALFSLDLAGAATAQATVRLSRPGAATPAWEETYAAESGNLETVLLDLRGLAPGPYLLEVLDGALAVVPGLGFELYLDPEAVGQGWFGVIEIEAGSGDLALLDGGGALRSPRYTLRFLNRATRWRYLFPAAQELGTGAEVAAEGSDGSILVTAAPRPLTRFGTGVRLQADDPTTTETSEEVLLPEPETHRIQRRNAQWYSEIHMSNLPL